jgi:hypothetical protein
VNVPVIPKDTASLLDRVRKLLALANSPNVHEASLAAARAQDLIETHRLTGLLAAEAQTDANPVEDGAAQPLEVGRRVRKWKQSLAAQLAEMNGCIAYMVGERGDQRLLLAGRADDRAVVMEVWAWLVQRIEWLSATNGEGRDRAWHDAFRVGASETIVERMQQARLNAHVAFGSAALAKVEPLLQKRALATREFADKNLRLKRARGLRVDADGYTRGRLAGLKLPI